MKAYFFLCMATVLWGLNFHLAKIMLQQVGFIEAGFWRYLLGVGFLFCIQLGVRSTLPSIQHLRKHFKGFFLAGFVGLFGFSIFFFLGLKYTSALNAALQVSLNPIFTLIFASFMLGTPVLRHHKVGTSVALIGVFLLLTKGQPFLLLEANWSYGDGLICFANVLFAVHHIWVKKYYTGEISNISFTLITNGFCLLGFILIVPFIPHTPVANLNAAFWLSSVGIGIVGTGLAYILWNEGIKISGATQAGLFMNVVPFATAIFALFFGEKIEWYHLYSGVLILLGMLIFQRKQTAQT